MKWPLEQKVTIPSKWRIRPGFEKRIRPGTVGMLCAASMQSNNVTVWVNPAIGWEGTVQELFTEWEMVPDSTELTF